MRFIMRKTLFLMMTETPVEAALEWLNGNAKEL